MSQSKVPVTTVDTPSLARYETIYRREVERLARDLTERRVTLDDWRDAMLKEIALLTLMAFATGKGGLKNVTSADNGIIQQKTAQQQAFITRWYEQLKPLADNAGLLIVGAGIAGAVAKLASAVWTAGQPLSIAGLIARAMLYVESAKVTLQIAHGLVLGMPLLPAYPKDGQSACLWICYCHWSIVHLGKRDWDCTWVLDPERDNCPQCATRAIEWRPLEIRGGVIQPYNPIGLFA